MHSIAKQSVEVGLDFLIDSSRSNGIRQEEVARHTYENGTELGQISTRIRLARVTKCDWL